MGKSRIEEHRAFFDWLVKQIKEKEPDALLVSGDIFDHGLPPHDVQKLYFETLIKIIQNDCRHVILTAGNHDSVSFLEASRQMCEALGIKVFSHLKDDLKEHLCPVYSKHEELLGHVFAIPYLRERELRFVGQSESIDSRRPALLDGIKKVYEAIPSNDSLPIVAMGHFFAVGSQMGDSERELYLGECEAIPLHTLGDAWDYLALGHLHRAQSVGQNNHARYSGTPLPMSFKDGDQEKVILEVDLKTKMQPKVQKIQIPRFRQIVSLKLTAIQLEKELSEVSFSKDGLETWLEICLDEPKPWDWISSIIQKSLDEKHAEVLSVRFDVNENRQEVQEEDLESLDLLTPKVLFETYLKDSEVELEECDQLLKKFDQILHELVESGVSS